MRGMLSLDGLGALVENGEIDTVLVAITDMQGRLVGKRVTSHYFLSHAAREWHACDYLLANDMDMEPVPGFEVSSWQKGYGDFAVRPDLATLRRIPWLDGTALVLGDPVDHHGHDLAHSPRAILKRQLARAAELGFTTNMASELEFYVFDEGFAEARKKHYREDYHIFQTTKEEPLIRAVRNGMDGAGIPVEFSKGEWGPGQAEINLYYADGLTMADRHAIYKNGVKEIAFLQGRAVTFMAKPFNGQAGNSCHVHISLADRETGESVFHHPSAEDALSKTARQFLAGQLAFVGDLTCLLAPFVNSYKRFEYGSFAPTKLVWSQDNRTAGFRVCGHGASVRTECRVPGADANPYLAFAALLGAGLDGIEQELELGPRFAGNAYDSADVPEVPHTLTAALDRFERSEAAERLLGEVVQRHYLHAGRWEQSLFERRVTDWELQRYFERA
jgi:glutamine synthetase